MERLRLVPVDFNKDSNFLNQCLKACVEHLERQATDNTILSVLHLEESVNKGTIHLFKALADDKEVGMMTLEFHPNDITEIHAVLLPNERKGFRAVIFLKMMCDYVFQELGKYKIKALVQRLKRNPAEVVARRVGFKKEGLLKGEWNGYHERGDVLILGYLKTDYDKDNARRNAPSDMIET
jgi:RimJ/RimL family protein N-acetyltransferase